MQKNTKLSSFKIKHARREKERASQLESGEKVYEPKPPTSGPADSPANIDPSPKIGVVIAFNLPAASYATMLLREFLSTHDDSESSGKEEAEEGEEAVEEDDEVTGEPEAENAI